MKNRLVIGYNSCLETLKVRPKDVVNITYDAKNLPHEIQDFVNKYNIKTKKTSKIELDKLGSGHQGLALEVKSSPDFTFSSQLEKSKLILFLDEIEDPQNLGAIIRTSWLMQVDVIFIPNQGSANLNSPVVNKVASGGAEYVPVIETHFPSTVEQIKEAGFWCYGLGESASKSFYEIKFPPKSAFFLGNEGKGLRKTTTNLCDEMCFIPQVKTGSSYNVSVATAIVLAEFKRQTSWIFH